jgi:hypothetical protein
MPRSFLLVFQSLTRHHIWCRIMIPAFLLPPIQKTANSITPDSSAEAISSSGSSSGRRWFVNPVVDLLFCCGGAIWLVVAFALLAELQGSSFNIFFMLSPAFGAFVLSDPHNAATLVRLYQDAELAKKLAWLTYAAPVLFLLLAIACMMNSTLLSYSLRIYFVFIAQHTTMQAYGVALAYCQKQGLSLNSRERDILKRAFFAIVVYAIAHQLSLPLPAMTFKLSFALGFASPLLQLPAWVHYATALFLGFALLELACMLVTRGHCKQEFLPMPVVLLLSTCLLIFLLPQTLMWATWLYVPAFFHASQYLCVTGRYTMNKVAQTRGLQQAPGFWSNDFFGYAMQIFCIGLTLYALLPAISRMFGVSYPIAYGAIFCAVNLHHFCADFVLWRQRDPALRQLIVS